MNVVTSLGHRKIFGEMVARADLEHGSHSHRPTGLVALGKQLKKDEFLVRAGLPFSSQPHLRESRARGRTGCCAGGGGRAKTPSGPLEPDLRPPLEK